MAYTCGHHTVLEDSWITVVSRMATVDIYRSGWNHNGPFQIWPTSPRCPPRPTRVQRPSRWALGTKEAPMRGGTTTSGITTKLCWSKALYIYIYGRIRIITFANHRSQTHQTKSHRNKFPTKETKQDLHFCATLLWENRTSRLTLNNIEYYFLESEAKPGLWGCSRIGALGMYTSCTHCCAFSTGPVIGSIREANLWSKKKSFQLTTRQRTLCGNVSTDMQAHGNNTSEESFFNSCHLVPSESGRGGSENSLHMILRIWKIHGQFPKNSSLLANMMMFAYHWPPRKHIWDAPSAVLTTKNKLQTHKF